MPSFKEIKEEINPKNTILKYTEKLHEKTGRNIIIYYSGWLNVDDEKISIDSTDKNGFMYTIKDLDKSKGLDLVLHTQEDQLKQQNPLSIIFILFLERTLEQLYHKWQCLEEQ